MKDLMAKDLPEGLMAKDLPGEINRGHQNLLAAEIELVHLPAFSWFTDDPCGHLFPASCPCLTYLRISASLVNRPQPLQRASGCPISNNSADP